MRGNVLAFACLVASCGGYAGVPPTEPHGTLLVRYLHADRELAYDDTLVVDGHSLSLSGVGAREKTLRLKPGTHLLYLSSVGTRYTLHDQSTQRPATEYAGTFPASTTKHERQTKFVPSASSDCSRDLALTLAQGRQQLALLVASGNEICVACVSDDLRATSCSAAAGADSPKVAAPVADDAHGSDARGTQP
jgi:hypothetical protein